MWSHNKYINITINTLLFLLGLNFLYAGQFYIPLICLILYIDNRFKFRVSNKYIFILLCIFSLTYYLFSFDLGYYGLISFCLPMCYYIGSNIKDKSKFRYVIYLLALGMAMHLIINMIYELCFLYDFDIMYMFSKSNHYEIWLQRKVNSTLTALNSVFLIGTLYFVAFYESNRKIKIFILITYALALFYCFALGRRTTPILLIGSIGCAFLLDFVFLRRTITNWKRIAIIIISFILLTTVVVILIKNNIFGIYGKLVQTRLVQKLLTQGLESGRIDILIEAIKIAPNHLWGGREILNELGSYVHDLWGDIYDYSGIVSYLLMITISLICVLGIVKFAFNKQIDKKTKILVLPWFACVAVIAFVEPLLSGGTILLFSAAIVISMIEELYL